MGYSAGGKKTLSTTIEKTRTLDTKVTTVRSNGARYLVFTVTDGAGNKSVVRVKIYIDTELERFKNSVNHRGIFSIVTYSDHSDAELEQSIMPYMPFTYKIILTLFLTFFYIFLEFF